MWGGEFLLYRRMIIDSMVRPERVELPTFWFVAKRSIQLSYGRTLPEKATGDGLLVIAFPFNTANTEGSCIRCNFLLLSTSCFFVSAAATGESSQLFKNIGL